MPFHNHSATPHTVVATDSEDFLLPAQKGSFAVGPGVGVFGPRGVILQPSGPGVGVFGPRGAILLPVRLGKDIWGPERLFHQLCPDLVCLLFRIRGVVDIFFLRSLFIVVQKCPLSGALLLSLFSNHVTQLTVDECLI